MLYVPSVPPFYISGTGFCAPSRLASCIALREDPTYRHAASLDRGVTGDHYIPLERRHLNRAPAKLSIRSLAFEAEIYNNVKCRSMRDRRRNERARGRFPNYPWSSTAWTTHLLSRQHFFSLSLFSTLTAMIYAMTEKKIYIYVYANAHILYDQHRRHREIFNADVTLLTYD